MDVDVSGSNALELQVVSDATWHRTGSGVDSCDPRPEK